MKKKELRALVEAYGDAIITYSSLNSRKLKYNVCTLDFSTPYIQTKKNRAQETEDTLLLWSWDVDGFRLLNASSVTKVEPLSSILRNEI